MCSEILFASRFTWAITVECQNSDFVSIVRDTKDCYSMQEHSLFGACCWILPVLFDMETRFTNVLLMKRI